MLKDVVSEKQKVKENGIIVDGRNYTINFTGIVKFIDNVHARLVFTP